MEPPPSVPSASGAWPVATAAAAPPDEPPALRERSHGLRVAPKSGLSVSGLWPNSRRGGLADEDRAGLAKPADGDRVLARHLVGEDARAHRRPHAPGEQQILDRERHAVERAERLARHHRRLGAAGRLTRLLGGHGDERVHPGLQGLDAL